MIMPTRSMTGCKKLDKYRNKMITNIYIFLHNNINDGECYNNDSIERRVSYFLNYNIIEKL